MVNFSPARTSGLRGLQARKKNNHNIFVALIWIVYTNMLIQNNCKMTKTNLGVNMEATDKMFYVHKY